MRVPSRLATICSSRVNTTRAARRVRCLPPRPNRPDNAWEGETDRGFRTKGNFCMPCGTQTTACATNHRVRNWRFSTVLFQGMLFAAHPMRNKGLRPLSKCSTAFHAARIFGPGSASLRHEGCDKEEKKRNQRKGITRRPRDYRETAGGTLARVLSLACGGQCGRLSARRGCRKLVLLGLLNKDRQKSGSRARLAIGRLPHP